MSTNSCFHCALPIPDACHLSVDIDGNAHPVCCPGCKAVAELIRDSGMSNYYELRDAPAPGVGRPPDEAAEWQVFNSREMLEAFTGTADGNAEATIYAGGMYCSACSWLIDSSLSRVDGIRSVEVNPMTHRVRVAFEADELGLGDILTHLADLGYQPQALTPDDTTRPEISEQRTALKRLLVASLGMMQVMMFAVGLYAGEFQGIDADMQRFLRLVSFLVTTPVVFYSARPFFAGAWRGIAAKMPGMDVPVSIAIGAAYAASVYSTFTNGAAVWFDSVTMFVFFLTVGRYLEMRARHRSIDRSVALSQVLPNTATRLQDGARSVVPVSQLAAGDVVVVRTGDSVPADGIVIRGDTSVDESLLSGEADPQRRGVGDRLAAGSINVDGVVDMRIETTGNDTAIGAIARLTERARYARPAFVQTADRIASYIVVALLFVAAAVATYWYFTAPERAFVITLSVLVVTCPCALALATPAAFATAANRFSELQLLVTNGNAIESLSTATHFLFDKTGTLTTGRPVVSEAQLLDANYDIDHCLRIASALEQFSSHPIAHAFAAADDLPAVTDPVVHVAEGVSGIIDGDEWRIGSAGFARIDSPANDDTTTVCLTCNGSGVARFNLSDEMRPHTADIIDELRQHSFGITLASGDNDAAVQNIADALGIEDRHAGCTPAAKLELIRSRQAAGKRVIMVGDGINDAPVLAGADASIAPAHGALLAQNSADVILLGESLRPLLSAVSLSRRTIRIVRQNLAWAIVYNLLALPLAAAGYVPPWAAAVGMSASSLVVVLNALRLNRYN